MSSLKLIHKFVLFFFILFGIIGIILTSLSFAVVEVNTMAIKRELWKNKIDEYNLYLPGRYFIGMTSNFISFPSIVQRIEYTDKGSNALGIITAQTNSLSEIKFKAIIYFKLQSYNLHKIYKKFPNNNYFKYYSVLCKNAIIEVTSSYTNQDFYSNRPAIASYMAQRIQADLNLEFADLVNFNLQEIYLPLNIEQGIIDSVLSANRIEIANINQKVNQIKATIELTKSQGELNAQNNIAQGYSSAEISRQQAKNTADQTIINAEVIFIRQLQ